MVLITAVDFRSQRQGMPDQLEGIEMLERVGIRPELASDRLVPVQFSCPKYPPTNRPLWFRSGV